MKLAFPFTMIQTTFIKVVAATLKIFLEPLLKELRQESAKSQVSEAIKQAIASNSAAIEAITKSNEAIAKGRDAIAKGRDAIAKGQDAIAKGQEGIADGNKAISNGIASITKSNEDIAKNIEKMDNIREEHVAMVKALVLSSAGDLENCNAILQALGIDVGTNAIAPDAAVPPAANVVRKRKINNVSSYLICDTYTNTVSVPAGN